MKGNKIVDESLEVNNISFSYKGDYNQLEDYDDHMNYIGEEKELSKEDARKKFLDNYDNEITSKSFKDIEEEPKSKKHKGKRFK